MPHELGLSEEQYDLYGRYKAKIDHRELERRSQDADGKLILVTAMTPTPGEGKTTTSVGLARWLTSDWEKSNASIA